ncbi:MAG: GNAT family N-acetyltransferase [Bacteroidota bacterium]
MTKYEYKGIIKVNTQSILDLYQSVNWTNYTKNSIALLKGIENSLCTIGAFREEQLIGLIRIVGDGYTIIYIQDILVHPNHQRNGVGQELMKRALNKYSMVRQKVLLADTSDELNHFYQKMGFTPTVNLDLICHVRLDS